MQLQVFDFDYRLIEDPATKDLAVIYNEEAVNSSIDIFLSMPYRIGLGVTNNLANNLFTDLNVKTEQNLTRDIQESFARDYSFLTINELQVKSHPNSRKIYVKLDWSVTNYALSGTYTRFWQT